MLVEKPPLKGLVRDPKGRESAIDYGEKPTGNTTDEGQRPPAFVNRGASNTGDWLKSRGTIPAEGCGGGQRSASLPQTCHSPGEGDRDAAKGSPYSVRPSAKSRQFHKQTGGSGTASEQRLAINRPIYHTLAGAPQLAKGRPVIRTDVVPLPNSTART